jgi:hypothetical protein
LYFNVLRDSVEDLITRRWPGLTYKLFIPCMTRTADGSACPGKFSLAALLRLRERGALRHFCEECTQEQEISLLLTGFTAPDVPLVAQIEHFNAQLNRIEAGVTRVDQHVEQHAAETAVLVRRVLHAIGLEVTDCPHLFSISRIHPALIRDKSFYLEHYSLTLWCEHPDSWHSWDEATYQVDVPKGWFIRISPYVKLVLQVLRVAVPLAGSIAAESLPSDQLEHAQAHLDTMDKLINDLSSDPHQHQADMGTSGIGQSMGQLNEAEGAALRALRKMLFDLDPPHIFGGMRRVQGPAGDFLWVCPDHYRQYDPGLPVVP